MTTGSALSGHCRCGAVTASIDRDPKWVAHCHCGDCRKASGAAFTTYAGFDSDAVKIEGPVRAYESSPGVIRQFCGTCGTPVAFQGEKWPGEIHLHIGFLDHPEALQPKVHVQWAERLPNVPLGDDLPKFERFSGNG